MFTAFLTSRETNKLPPQSLRESYIWFTIKLNIAGVESEPSHPQNSHNQQLPYRGTCYLLAVFGTVSDCSEFYSKKLLRIPYCRFKLLCIIFLENNQTNDKRGRQHFTLLNLSISYHAQPFLSPVCFCSPVYISPWF